jgi:hypothetical protein
MHREFAFRPGERFLLGSLSAVGFVVLNSVFLYGLLVRPDLHEAAVRNPVALVFMVEALLLMLLLAWLFHRWRLSRIHWLGFVALTMVGSLAFSVPLALLFPRRETAREGEAR